MAGDGPGSPAPASPPMVPRVHTRTTTLAVAPPPERMARQLSGFRELMIADRVPVRGRGRVVVAAGPLLAFSAHGRWCEWSVAGGRRHPVGAPDGAWPALWRQLSGLEVVGGEVPAPLRSMFGFVSYEAVRGMERLPARHPPVVPDYQFFFPQLSAAIGEDSTELVAFGMDEAHAETALRAGVEAVTGAAGAPDVKRDPPVVTGVRSQSDQGRYAAAVERAKQHLYDGDIFQVVLAVQQHLAVRADPLWLYRRLRVTSPDTFRFCYLGPAFAATGATPEPFVTVVGQRARVRPLAGTRPRGATAEEDRQLEQELRSSVKELAEHRMLVDLARNDLGRVCEPGTVRVDELLAIERYAHVMHLVSNVVGELPDARTGGDVLRAAFPAGTMTGAPKIRAMEIIDSLEPEARGLYAGLVGAVAPDEIHTYLTIRSAVLRNGTVTIGAGAGIVHDSDPGAEYQECLAKLRTISQLLIHPAEVT